MIHIYIKKENRVYTATCNEYSDINFTATSYEEVKNIMVEYIKNKVSNIPEIVPEKFEKKKISFGFSA